MKAIGCFRIRRSLFRLSCLFLLLSPLLHAQTSESTSAVPQPTTLEEAAAQRRQAEQLRTEAEERFAREQPACYKKILVNSCIEDAKKQRTQSMIAARKLEAPARDFEREARRAEVEGKAAQRDAELPKRDAEQAEQGEAYRAEEAVRAAEREKKLADKEEQAAKGRQKAAEEQAKRKAKLEKREKMLAEKAAKRAKEEAKAAEKAAATQ